MLGSQHCSSTLVSGPLEEHPEPMSKYEERLLDERCTRCGVPREVRAPLSGENMCERCKGIVQKAQARSVKAKRRARRRKKLCAFCGRKSKAYRCPRCRVKHYASRANPAVPIAPDRVGVANGVDHSEQIPRITREVEGDGYARTRSHGQPRRGQQPRSQLDDQDLVDAIKALIKARRALAIARAPENEDLPRVQKQDALNAALALVAYGDRFAAGVLERNNYRDADEMIDSDAKTRG